MTRYIDADKADVRTIHSSYMGYSSWADVLEWLKSQPTAEVVEVRHGRWENISGFDVCNVCGTSPAYCEPKPNNPKGYPPYCHQCGAKMDGGKAE